MQATRILAGTILAVMLAGVGWSDQPTTAPAPRTTPAKQVQAPVAGVALSKMPLMRVLKYYEGLCGLSIQVDWEKLRDTGVAKDAEVTLRTAPMGFDKLLDLTLVSVSDKDRPLAWYLSDRTIHVSTQTAVLLRNMPLPAPRGKESRGEGPVLPKEFSFDNAPLKDVLDYYQQLADVNFHVNWKALEIAGLSAQTPVTLKARGISIARALDLTLDQLNANKDRFSSVYWLIQEGVVEIATGDAFNRTTSTRVFEVGDLLTVVPNFKGPTIDITAAANAGNNSGTNNSSTSGGLFGNTNQGTNNNSTATDEEDVATLRQRVRDTLIDAIKLSIGEDMWAPTGKGNITLLRNKLIITQTPLGFRLLEQSTAIR